MTVYVLGAGASLHAGYPLGSQLRSQLEAWASRTPHPTSICNANFRERFSTLKEIYRPSDSLDCILTDLYERPPGSRAASLLVECPCFLADILEAFRQFFREIYLRQTQSHGPLKYERLASLIRPGDVVITFNYDLALERELRRAGRWEIGDGYGFSVLPDLPSQVKVLKLHGSINWYAAQRGGPGSVVIGSDLVGVRPVVGVDADWSYLGYEGLRDPAIANRILTEAAIMMPVEHKKFYYETSLGREWQNFWDDLWNQAGELLGESEEIVMIGYSLPAFDKRAREVLLCRSNHDAHVTICCGTDSDRIQQEFRKHGFSHLRYTANLSFEDWLGQVKQGVLMHRRKLKSGTKWGNWVLDTKRLTLDFKKRNDEYEVDLEDIRDSATMLDWIFQIQGKAWATHKIMGDLLDAFNDVFSPQANLCSGGKDHKINPKNHLAKTLS